MSTKNGKFLIWNLFTETFKHVLKTLYLQYYNGYDHKAYQNTDTPQEISIHNFLWSLNKVFVRGHVIN